MVTIIETNILMKGDSVIDFQSRTLNASSWDEYVNLFLNYNGEACGNFCGSMNGYTLHANEKVENVKYDEYHLKCNLIGKMREIKLAYLVGGRENQEVKNNV